MNRLVDYINREIAESDSLIANGDLAVAFHHLERAHILGQSRTFDHTRIHWRMLKLGLKMRSTGEIWGQFIRMIGAATKTPFGIYPKGNTGGENVWFFKPMPVPHDLQEILNQAKIK